MAIVMDGGGRMEEVYLEEEEEEEEELADAADYEALADYGAPAPPVRAPRLPCPSRSQGAQTSHRVPGLTGGPAARAGGRGRGGGRVVRGRDAAVPGRRRPRPRGGAAGRRPRRGPALPGPDGEAGAFDDVVAKGKRQRLSGRPLRGLGPKRGRRDHSVSGLWWVVPGASSADRKKPIGCSATLNGELSSVMAPARPGPVAS